MAEEYKIILQKDNELKYIVYVEDDKGFRHNHHRHTAEEIDKKFLLRKDTSFETGKIFGIAEDLEEVNERLYKSAVKQVKKFKKTYGKLGKIRIIDMTKAKGIEERF